MFTLTFTLFRSLQVTAMVFVNLIKVAVYSEYLPRPIVVYLRRIVLLFNEFLISGFDSQNALLQAKKAIDHVRSDLNDQWNFHGLYSGTGYGLDGLPWCTSHYTFHMVLWHIPFALSGQTFSAPNATLSFDPKVPCPYELPFYTPFAIGTLQCAVIHKKNQKTKKFEILSTSGDISLQELVVSDTHYPTAVMIKQGKVVTWMSHKE